jgi:phosphohistidine phosphatase SixA
MTRRDVFLVRHGKAADAGAGGDPARALTQEGREGIAAVGRALAAFGIAPEAIWHSPYVRTTETAGILADALGVRHLLPEPALAPASSGPRAALALTQAPARTLLTVSHMPLLPAIAAELVGAQLDFGPGTVAHIGLVGAHTATLLGLWTADQLGHVRS